MATKVATKQIKPSLAMIKKDVVDVVSQRINSLTDTGKLHLPHGYSAENALHSAWLKLQSVETKSGELALHACTPDTVANSLLDMVIMGLNPAKDQNYFIAYGKALTCQISRWGWEALVLRIYKARGYSNAQVIAQTVYKADEFEYDIVLGRKVIGKHSQKIENVTKRLEDIKAGYCIITSGGDLPDHTVIRTIDQIKQAWEASKTWKPGEPGTFHEDTPDHAVCRTVIARACREIVNTSDDSYLAKAVQRHSVMTVEAEVEEEMAEHANRDVMDFEPEPPQEPEAPAGENDKEEPETEGQDGPSF